MKLDRLISAGDELWRAGVKLDGCVGNYLFYCQFVVKRDPDSKFADVKLTVRIVCIPSWVVYKGLYGGLVECALYAFMTVRFLSAAVENLFYEIFINIYGMKFLISAVYDPITI